MLAKSPRIGDLRRQGGFADRPDDAGLQAKPVKEVGAVGWIELKTAANPLGARRDAADERPEDQTMTRPETQTDRLLRVTSQLAMEGMLLGLGLEMEPQSQPLPRTLRRRSWKNLSRRQSPASASSI